MACAESALDSSQRIFPFGQRNQDSGRAGFSCPDISVSRRDFLHPSFSRRTSGYAYSLVQSVTSLARYLYSAPPTPRHQGHGCFCAPPWPCFAQHATKCTRPSILLSISWKSQRRSFLGPLPYSCSGSTVAPPAPLFESPWIQISTFRYVLRIFSSPPQLSQHLARR